MTYEGTNNVDMREGKRIEMKETKRRVIRKPERVRLKAKEGKTRILELEA